MATDPKNVTCLDCEKEVVLTDDGKCPNCGLNMRAVLERDRHERAFEKLKAARQPKPEPKKSWWE